MRARLGEAGEIRRSSVDGGTAVGDARELADEVRRIRGRWEAAVEGGDAACGLPVAAEAFRRMCRAWSAELGVHAAALDELADLAGAGDVR